MHSKKFIIIIFLISLIVFTGSSVFRDVTNSTNFSLCVVLPLFSQTWADFELKDEERLSLETQKTPTFLEPCTEGKRSEDTLHYDGPNFSALGAGTHYYAGVRFTPAVSGTLIAVIFYHYEVFTHSGSLHVYEESTATNPGSEVRIEPYSVAGQGWRRIELSNSYPYEGGKDFWTAVEIFYSSMYPIGMDSGPAVDERGDWISYNGTTWEELQYLGIDWNWNERAIVHQEGGGIEEISSYQYSISNEQLAISPNPFSTSTTITIPRLSEHKIIRISEIELRIYDVSGRLVKDFSVGTGHSALGTALTWDGTNDRSKRVPPGLYFCTLKVGRYRTVRKIVKLY